MQIAGTIVVEWHKEEVVKRLFEQAGFQVMKMWRMENQYRPLYHNLNYYSTSYSPIPESVIQYIAKNPWWLVKTNHGLIEVGERKRVVVIDWSETKYRGNVTTDDITQTNTLVHAWNFDKFMEYLRKLEECLAPL